MRARRLRPQEPIYRRNLVFRPELRSRPWLAQGDVATAFYNALSGIFPEGERFFMESVRQFRADVSTDVRASIDGFLFQEGIHAREHRAFNKEANDSNEVVALMERRTRDLLDVARKYHPIGQLALTVSYEHLTAIVAREWLSCPAHFQGSTPEVQRLWRWHAMEELEHKAVAFDTYLAVTSQLSAIRRWQIRSVVMLGGTRILVGLIAHNMKEQLRSMEDRRYKRRLWYFLLVRPGLLSKVLLHYFEFFLPWYHPRNRNDSALIEQPRREFGYEQ